MSKEVAQYDPQRKEACDDLLADITTAIGRVFFEQWVATPRDSLVQDIIEGIEIYTRLPQSNPRRDGFRAGVICL